VLESSACEEPCRDFALSNLALVYGPIMVVGYCLNSIKTSLKIGVWIATIKFLCIFTLLICVIYTISIKLCDSQIVFFCILIFTVWTITNSRVSNKTYSLFFTRGWIVTQLRDSMNRTRILFMRSQHNVGLN
jgi:hypothetical protein